MATVHMTEQELVNNLEGVLAKVKTGDDYIIATQDERQVVMTLLPASVVPASPRGRKLSDCIEAAKRYEARLEGLAVADAAYASDVRAAVEERRDVFDPPKWD